MNQGLSQRLVELGPLQHFSERRGEPSWLRQQRQQAWQQLQAAEPAAWHHDPPPFSWGDLRWAGPEPGAGVGLGHPTFSSSTSLTSLAGAVATDLATAIRTDEERVRSSLFARALPLDSREEGVDPYTVALQATLWQDGLFIYVPAGGQIREPLRVVRQREAVGALSAAAETSPVAEGLPVRAEHTLLVLDEGAQLDLIWNDQTPPNVGVALLAQSWEIWVGPGARLRVAFIQDLSPSSYGLRTGRLVLARDSRVELVAAELGSAWSRTDWSTELTGPGASVQAVGLFVGTGTQRLDLALATHNRSDHTQAQTWGRGVLADQARGVFRGLGYVHQDAPASSNNQQTAALVLSKTARADVVPSLKIDEDEVQAGHGAVIGQVDEEALFYLMSRGLPRRQAIRLLVEGFLANGWERVSLAEAAAVVRERALAKLGERE